jgi:Protein of unknown function (DUF2802)
VNLSLILVAAAAAVAVGALVIAVAALQAGRILRARCESLEASIAALQREHEMVASISVRTGRRVQRVESEFSSVAERVDLVEARGVAAAGSDSLDQAIDWARHGAGTDKLTEQFGITAAEAELVTRLHGQKKSA